jgi:hypothetical protein
MYDYFAVVNAGYLPDNPIEGKRRLRRITRKVGEDHLWLTSR